MRTRAHAHTFGERHDEVLHSLNLEPTLSVRNLCYAIEKVVGKDMLVLRNPSAVAAPAAPPPPVVHVQTPPVAVTRPVAKPPVASPTVAEVATPLDRLPENPNEALLRNV
mgnify:CR=1 FL=1